VTPHAIALVVVAAAAHAGWNLIAKRAGGGLAFLWICCVCEAAVLLPLAATFAAVEPVVADASVLPVIAASGALHTAYLGVLQRSYVGGELSVVYPVIRGGAALLAVAVG
jgi:hypothetical protein